MVECNDVTDYRECNTSFSLLFTENLKPFCRLSLYLSLLFTENVVVVVCLPRPMEGMGRLQFSDLFTELPVPLQAAAVVATF